MINTCRLRWNLSCKSIPTPLTTADRESPYHDQIGMQVELHAHPGMTAQIVEIERVLRLLPSCITGDSNDVRCRV